MGLVHHDLCFGCGITNLFGLQMELEPVADGVAGRFFVKQDHQGPGGTAHAGVVTAALEEAMALAVHADVAEAAPRSLSFDLLAPAPVGAFVRVEARVRDRGADGTLAVSAIATDEEGSMLAEGSATFGA